MKKNHVELLKHILRCYGVAKVVSIISEITYEETQTTYADNKEAIIHQYAPVIRQASRNLCAVMMGRIKI